MANVIRYLRIILGDQLTRTISSLNDLDKKHDYVLMMEVAEETTYVPHHPQKIALVLAAMREFATELKQEKINVHYVQLDSDNNLGTFTKTLTAVLKQFHPEKIIITEPGEYRVLSMIQTWQKTFDIPVELRPDNRFFCSTNEFQSWAKNKKQLRMENFYRLMRIKTGILMKDETTPIGNRWNFDQENRKVLTNKTPLPKRLAFKHSEITQRVIALIKNHFEHNFGSLESFNYATTRKNALEAMHFFVKHLLPSFGDYQDAMLLDEFYLYHSLLSPYLNIGLLLPEEVCRAAENAYHTGKVSLNSVEGFIRQVLGWREFMRGIYWLMMPDYTELNFFNAKQNLPDFYWHGKTNMRCLEHAIQQTKLTAYSHHIQRLMITGNFALLTGVEPKQICEWYLAVYIDAFEWVELPNTLGMSMFADGGYLASKPYASSGNYIHKMSNFCGQCHYNVKKKIGDDACPFNYLYWDFLIRNTHKLEKNMRLKFSYQTLKKMPVIEIEKIQAQAKKFLASL